MNYHTVKSDTALHASNFVDLLCQQAKRHQEQTIYTFISEDEINQLTFHALAHQAAHVAAALRRAGAAGERALLLYPPGLDYVIGFFGCLCAGVTAVPVYPPDPLRLNRTLPRLQAIAADAQAAFALTTTPVLGLAETLFDQAPVLQKLTWLATDTITPPAEADWQPPPINGETLAFLQYTSGSTGAPKGVMLTHANLLHNSALIAQAFAVEPTDVGISWLPPYHDMGLIGGILQPLYSGIHCVLMSPLTFLQRPFRWLQTLSDYKGSISGGPNFAYDLCARKITPAQRAELDLSHWRLAFNGAEPVRPDTLDQFAAAFADCGFRRRAFFPCYGLAECTLIVSGDLRRRAPFLHAVNKSALLQNRIVAAAANDRRHDVQQLVGCGQSLGEQEIIIVDPQQLTRLDDDQIGEIWLAGGSVAAGYWNQPAETAVTFHARPAGAVAGRYLRTGDLGFIHDGELFITGRTKDLIIIRGRNHYPHDVERTVEQSHPALRPGCGAAFSIDVGREERLVVVQEIYTKRPFNPTEVIDAIRQAVANAHEVQVYAIALIRPRTIPKTSSGKIQRHACREQYLSGALELVNEDVLESVADRQTDEKRQTEPLLIKAFRALPPAERHDLLLSHLIELLSQTLALPAAQLRPHTTLPAAGLDSALAVEIAHEIESTLGVRLRMENLLQNITISQLASQLVTALTAPPETAVLHEIPLPPETAVSNLHPLSHGQRALWFLHQLYPHSPAYNVVHAVRLCAAVDIPALQDAFARLVQRHETLRTTFCAQGGTPLQQIHEQMDGVCQVVDASAWSQAQLDERLAAELVRPFDLEQGPLLRVHLFTRRPDESILLLAMHHIITDLWSLALIMHEAGQLYAAAHNGRSPSLKPLRARYVDFVNAQQQLLAGPEGERQRAFWLQQLRGALPTLPLATDHARPAVPTYRGACESARINADLSARLKALAKAHNATPFMLLLAVFHTLLHRYTGQDDILIGTPMANRSRDVARLAGYFVNPVVIRANLANNPPFTRVLEQVRQTALDAFSHSDYPFPLLVEQLQPARDASQTPLFQVMFAWQKTTRLINSHDIANFALGEDGAQMELGGVPIASLTLPQWVSPFDLTLMMAEAGDELIATFEYSTDLFAADAIRRMLDHFQILLAGIAANPQQPLSELPLLNAAEWRQVTAAAAAPPPTAVFPLLPQAIEAQTAVSPHAPALSLDDTTWTYAQLNRRANQLARALQAAGARPGTAVAVLAARALPTIVALLATLKTGAAYLPLDPDQPRERLAFMLEDAQPTVLLTVREAAASSDIDDLRLEVSQESSIVNRQSKIVNLDDWPTIAQQSDANLPPAAAAEDTAYIIYTSGTTGRPKGVCIPYAAITHHCRAVCRHYALTAVDRVLQFAAFSFDQSLEQILPPLLAGAHVLLRGPDVWPPADFPAYLAAQRLSVVNLPPAYWDQVVAAWADAPQPLAAPDLRLMIIGGDVVRPETVAHWRKLPLAHVRLLNAYGPTETTITATTCEISADPETAVGTAVGTAVPAHIPIGRPLPHRAVLIVDPHNNPVPTGVPGELLIGGPCLASGYLNQPALTAERFVPNPVIGNQFSVISNQYSVFSQQESALRSDNRSLQTVYRTGDRCRWLPGGEIEFLGRIDDQVKVRGFRIELGEIEAVLGQHPRVRQTAVIAYAPTPTAEKQLVAYLAADVQEIDAARELRSFLQQRLPDYMVPAAFITLDALPLTSSGKIDRRALPAPTQPGLLSDAYAPPRTPVEETLVQMWADLLGIEPVNGRSPLGIHHNFFELGGHSLLVTRLASRLRDTFQVDIPLRTLFAAPTIANLSLLIAQQQARQAEENDVLALLTELEALSDQDVKTLLVQQK